MTNKKNGFTLIELLLAMAFISFMLLFVALAVMQVTKLYVKGSAIRQINQTGRQVLGDLSKTMRYAKTQPIYDQAHNRLCVGGISYLWNIEGQTVVNTYTTPDTGVPLRFISVQDPSGTLCASPFNSVSRTGTTDLVGADITPMKFAISSRGSLWDVLLVLSTGGSNLALSGQATPTGFSCDPNNNFCAFGDFETSIYSRGE